MADATVIAARRYGDLHPGFRLVQALEAAVPVSLLTLDLLVQERKPLPLVDEFLLRLCDQGIGRVPDIAALLGLDEDTVFDAAAQQLSAENIDYRPDPRYGGRVVQLTPAGQRAVVDLVTVTPQRTEQTWAFDRLLWKPTSYVKSDLLTRAEATDEGLLILPSLRTHDVTLDNVTARSLNQLLERGQLAGADSEIQILTVEDIAKQSRRFLPAVLLVFEAVGFEDVRLSVVIDDMLSEPHDLALVTAGGAERLAIRLEPPTGEPDLPPEVVAQRVPHDVVLTLQRRADDSRPPSTASNTAGNAQPDNHDRAAALAELASFPVRSVPAFEHRQLLVEALGTAKSRFLLIASSVRNAVLTDEVVSKLETMLRRPGLTAHIAYGADHGDTAHDAKALDRLTGLARRHTNLTLRRLQDNHPKALIFDDTWINTNFNWLSFRGDPTRTHRMEEGTLVRIKNVVDDQYAQYLTLIDDEDRNAG